MPKAETKASGLCDDAADAQRRKMESVAERTGDAELTKLFHKTPDGVEKLHTVRHFFTENRAKYESMWKTFGAQFILLLDKKV